MTLRSTHQLHPAFASSYRRLEAACMRLGVKLETPSRDGYVRVLTNKEKSIMFTAASLPLNTAAAYVLARDKIATYQLLETHGLPIPHWFPFFGDQHLHIITNAGSDDHIEHLENNLAKKFPAFPGATCTSLIVKPSNSSGGNGVVRCTTKTDVIDAAHKALAYSHGGVVQEYIDGIDYRVVFLDDRILVATYEDKRDGNAKPLLDEHLSDNALAITTQAQKLLGLRYGSIDFRKKSDGSFIILELNSNPGFDRLEKYYPDRVATITDTVLRALLGCA